MGETFDIDAAYRRYGPMVFRRCLQLLRDEARAADAMQDVFVQLVRYREGLSAGGQAALLNRIATNVCLNRLRGQRVRGTEESDDVLHDIANADDPEGRTLAARLLAKLFAVEHASSRTLAVLHFVDGMSLEEVAQEVGLSVSGVRYRLRQLRAQLKALTVEVPS